MLIDFDKHQTRLILEGIVTQTILPANSIVNEGDILPIRFGGLEFKDSFVEVLSVKRTSVKHLSHIDAFKEGYCFKPFFIEHLREKGFTDDDAVLKVDFKITD